MKIKIIIVDRWIGVLILSEEKLKYLLVFLNDFGIFFYFKSLVFFVFCNVS